METTYTDFDRFVNLKVEEEITNFENIYDLIAYYQTPQTPDVLDALIEQKVKEADFGRITVEDYDHNTSILRQALKMACRGLATMPAGRFHPEFGNEASKFRKKMTEADIEANKSRAKMPLGNRWQERASLDFDDIVRNFSEYPTAIYDKNRVRTDKEITKKISFKVNICLVTGGRFGYFALDADNLDKLAELESEYGKLPFTLQQRSGSGKGQHYIFRIPPHIQDMHGGQNRFGGHGETNDTGLDIRGKGGQIIISPSLHKSGGTYEFLTPWETTEIAAAPEWVVDEAIKCSKIAQNEIAAAASVDDTDPFSLRAKKLRDATAAGSGKSVEQWLSTIGDGEGLSGYHSSINSSCLAWWRTNGIQADTTVFKEQLRQAILNSPCKDTRNIGYATAEKLDAYLKDAKSLVEKTPPPTQQQIVGVLRLPYPYEVHNGCIGEWKGDDNHKVFHKLCALFELVGHTVDETGRSGYGLMIRFAEKQHGELREVVISDAAMRVDSPEVIERLSDAGFWTYNTAEARGKFLAILGELNTDKIVTIASHAGWIDDTFLTPYGEAIGAEPAMRLQQSKQFIGPRSKGSLKGWQQSVEDMHRMMDFHGIVVVSAGFAGVIVDRLGFETCILVISGDSSHGKSSTQYQSGTTFSDPRIGVGCVTSARGTANGLETKFEKATGTALHLDEMKGMKPEEVGDVIFMASSGVSKVRDNGNQENQWQKRWSTFVTASAEQSLGDIIAQTKGGLVSGHNVRAVEIDITNTKLHHSASEVSAWKAKIGDNYGWAGPEFVRYLVSSGLADRERLLERVNKAEQFVLADTPNVTGITARAAMALAIALAAGEIAVEAGILPVTLTDLHKAFKTAWSNCPWGDGSDSALSDPKSAFEMIRNHIKSIWHLRVYDIDKVAEKAGLSGEPRLAAWFYTDPAFCDETGAYEAVAKIGFHQMLLDLKINVKPQAILRWMKQQGFLIPRGSHLFHQVLLQHGDVQNYRFKKGTFGPA